jgi:penicillin-binding protein 1B
MAGAYTAFANGGTRVNPILISSLRDAKGSVIENFQTTRRQVLDPRIAYIMSDMLQGPLNFGTAYGVRARGFSAPAAGKTGSSHDAWFAGYTTQLLCIVWVGYDDYSDIHFSGAQAAAPIWGEFMKRAVKLPGYANPQPFAPPAGVVQLTLDKTTNLVATPACPDDYSAAFIEGTQPTQSCDQSGGGIKGFFSKILGLNPKPAAPPPVSNSGQQVVAQPAGVEPGHQAQGQATQPPPKKKKGFWGRLFGGGDDKSQNQSQNQPNPTGSDSQEPH